MFIRYFVLCFALGLLWLPPVAANPEPYAGLIKNTSGDVRIERGDTSIPAQVGEPVQSGDRIRVVGKGSVGISMRDETLLSLGPDSVLVIDNYRYDPKTRDGQVETSILKGTLRYVSGLIARHRPEAIRVNTPSATMGIRGTDFIVEVRG